MDRFGVDLLVIVNSAEQYVRRYNVIWITVRVFGASNNGPCYTNDVVETLWAFTASVHLFDFRLEHFKLFL